MVLDEGKVIVKTCDMEGGECNEKTARMKYELDCKTRLDDPAASIVSLKENIEAITNDPGIKLEDGKEFKYNIEHCLEVIYKEDPKDPKSEEDPQRMKLDFCLNQFSEIG